MPRMERPEPKNDGIFSTASHFEIGGDKRISQHLSGRGRPSMFADLVSGYLTNRALARQWREWNG
jgi:hypothetical protein